MLTATKINAFVRRKIATAVLVTAYVAAFATLGDGGRKESRAPSAELSVRNFSLRTPYNYKSNSLFTCSSNPRFIMLNTVVTYQKGNATYILPLKKRVLLEKIRFNPAPVRF